MQYIIKQNCVISFLKKEWFGGKHKACLIEWNKAVVPEGHLNYLDLSIANKSKQFKRVSKRLYYYYCCYVTPDLLNGKAKGKAYRVLT